MTIETIHKTPLNQVHLDLGAKMVEFGGWEMPLQYDGILQEHIYNREGCSIFDCSHMGEFFIKGDVNETGLNRLVSQKIDDMAIGECRYGTICNEQGFVLDDCIVYCMAQDYWGIVVNAANIEKNRNHFKKHLSLSAEFEDASMRIAKLDIQGPLSREVLLPLIPCVADLDYYTFKVVTLLGQEAIVSRTGYTGELGFEIYFPWDKAVTLWNAILKDKRVKPTGLGVRDVLRIEMCYPLYGHELSEQIYPLDAGLRRFVDFDKEFIGQEELLKYDQHIQRQSVCLMSESRRAPREGFGIFNQKNEELGVVTSGTFSPALNVGIALGLVKKGSVQIGDELICRDGKKEITVRVTKRPFLKETSLKN